VWNFPLFAPAAACLVGLAWWLAGTKVAPSSGKSLLLAIGLWVLAWLATVGYIALTRESWPETFVAQRDLGYLIGSLLFIAAPFVVVLLTATLVRRTTMTEFVRVSVSIGTAVVAWFFFPWLFLVGWIMGCVFAGYRSCM